MFNLVVVHIMYKTVKFFVAINLHLNHAIACFLKQSHYYYKTKTKGKNLFKLYLQGFSKALC